MTEQEIINKVENIYRSVSTRPNAERSLTQAILITGHNLGRALIAAAIILKGDK